MSQYPADSSDSPLAVPGISIRDAQADIGVRASRESDRAFLHAVYASTRTEEFARAGWDADEIRTLLASQFAIQDAYYRRHSPHARFDIVLRGAAPIGRLYHDWSGSEARVIDIALLPQHRGAGIGARLMRALVAGAAQRGMPMSLYVELNNPVRSLYGRLGFVAAGENGIYALMRREAAPFDSESEERIDGLETSAA